MEITKEEHYNVFYNGIEYIRFSGGCWTRWYGESLEQEYTDERELEKIFQREKIFQ